MKVPLFFMFIFILGLLGLGYTHEQVHVEIYRGYGIDSHVEYFSHFPNMVTIADKGCPSNECMLAHNINEIVGYPLMVIYSVVAVLFVVMLILKEDE